MADETEEFEFRARMEREQAASKPEFNVLQKRMGLGRQGNSMETIRSAIDTAGVNAGRAVTDQAAKVLPPEGAAALGYGTNFLINAATEAPGALLGGAGTKAATSPAIVSLAKKTMQSALGPSSKAIANGSSAKAITTMLEEGVQATPSGAAKLRGEIDKLRGEVNDLIRNSPESVDKAYVASALHKTLAKFKDQVNPKADVDAIMKSWQEFNALVGAKIPVQQAQNLKTGTQSALRNAYGRVTDSPAAEAAQKAMASGLREGLEDAVPGVAQRNAAMSAKHNVLNILEPTTAKAGNKSLAGFAPVTHTPEMAALMLADRNPYIKSSLAHLLYKGSGAAPTAAGGLAGALATGTSGKTDRLDAIIEELRRGSR